MNDVISNTQEYHAFLDCYRSEGFSILMKLIDVEIAKLYESISTKDHNAETLLKLANTMRGLRTAKEVGFNALKENEIKFKKDNK